MTWQDPVMTTQTHAAAALAMVGALLASTNQANQLTVDDLSNHKPVLLDAYTKRKIRVVPLATGLVHPWNLSFLPDGAILVTERPGRLRIIRNGVLDPQPISNVPAVVARGTAGLFAAVPHPNFAQNGFVYLSYAKPGDGKSTVAITRARLDGQILTDAVEIFVADAWQGGGNHGGRMLFARDGALFLTIGDRDPRCCDGSNDNSLRMKAQDLGTHAGKTLRLKDDGTAPRDNPLASTPGAKPEIFTYGHRSGIGLAFHPETNELWQSEIGPLGGDELNILLPGRNYGWPLVSLGRNYNGTLVSDEPWFRRGMENPRIFWVPSIGPSAIAFYTGDKFPSWKGSLFVAALTSRELQRITFNEPGQAERRERLLVPLGMRIRDVRQGPDGYLYLATEVAMSGNVPDGMVLRIEPADSSTP